MIYVYDITNNIYAGLITNWMTYKIQNAKILILKKNIFSHNLGRFITKIKNIKFMNLVLN